MGWTSFKCWLWIRNGFICNHNLYFLILTALGQVLWWRLSSFLWSGSRVLRRLLLFLIIVYHKLDFFGTNWFLLHMAIYYIFKEQMVSRFQRIGFCNWVYYVKARFCWPKFTIAAFTVLVGRSGLAAGFSCFEIFFFFFLACGCVVVEVGWTGWGFTWDCSSSLENESLFAKTLIFW